MNRRAQILTVLLVSLLVLAVVSIIGISLVSNKEISFSNFIKRAGDWFSSTISSLEYGLYSLNLQTIPAEQEITIPYFGEENLLPFFKAPFTITMYGEQVLPITYEGYFGFRDLFYPISWMFKWLVIRKEGKIEKVEVIPGEIVKLDGKYYVLDANNTTTDCSIYPIVKMPNPLILINFAYAALQLEGLQNCEAPLLNDGALSPSVIIGDNTSTSNLEDYLIQFITPTVKYIDYTSIYIKSLSGDGKVTVFYFDTQSQQFIETASTTLSGQFVNLPIKKNTNEIRIRIVPNSQNNYALIPEVYFFGY